MLSVEKLEAEAERRRDRADYVERLLRGLGTPSLAGWSFTGEIRDAGVGSTALAEPPRCACGHPIRWLYIIQHPERGQTQLGSECINRLADMPHADEALVEALRQAVQRTEAQLREAEAAVRRAEREREVQDLAAQWAAICARALAEYERRAPTRSAPHALWLAVKSRRHRLPRVAPRYKRPADYIRWYRAQILAWREALGEA